MTPKKDVFELDPELEREIKAALGDESLEDLLEGEEAQSKPSAAAAAEQEDRTRTGTIVAIHRDEAIVEFTAKDQGICSLDQFKKPPAVGERREFIIVSRIPGEALFRLVLPGGAAKTDWDSLAKGMTVEAMVKGKNTGGLELEVAGHRAFMPVSQIDTARVEELEPYVGTKLRAQVVELDKQRGRIVLSRRAALEAEAQENRRRMFETLEAGQEHPGVVRRIEKFGAFVELAPGVDGLLHVSDMAWARVKDPHEIVQIGQSITVKVLKVDAEEGRISLGLKQVSGDPWREVELKYPIGSQHTGTVTRTEAYGAFVELEPGVEGLVHVSQLGTDRVRRVEDVARTGTQITVQVVEVDMQRRRIGLSVRAMAEAQAAAAEDTARQEARQFLKTSQQAHAMQSLMSKFGGEGGLKGGIG